VSFAQVSNLLFGNGLRTLSLCVARFVTEIAEAGTRLTVLTLEKVQARLCVRIRIPSRDSTKDETLSINFD
jgi:hypothetical protein